MAVLDRRAVLAGLAASGACGLTGIAASAGRPAFVACCQLSSGDYAATVLDENAEILFTESIAGRGHDTAISPDRTIAVVFARRPGWFALVLDLVNNRRSATFAPPSGRHFYGHGFFSTDGRLLFATENDFDAERGVLGVYDATAGFARLTEFETGGIGPHEALLLRDGRTVAIANGGIITHPDFPRQKLNLPDMASSITLMDVTSGDLIETAALPSMYHQLSIRHMAEASDGSIWFGGQYEGMATDLVPLVGSYGRGRGIDLIEAPDALYRGMNQYIGSVAISSDGERAATTSPRGGKVVIWDTSTKRVLETRLIPDACGAASSQSGLLFSDGTGGLHLPGGKFVNHQMAWDNHISSLPAHEVRG